MADQLNSLLGSGISLISQVDIRYDGILFSINAMESKIILSHGEGNFGFEVFHETSDEVDIIFNNILHFKQSTISAPRTV